MIPLGSRYPTNYDDDSNLLLAKDSLKVRLGQDYNPGDLNVIAEEGVDKFPPKGVITLVDHCNPDHVTSFYYEKRGNNAFGSLSLTPGSEDTFKSRLSSVITQQLDALHHNSIKDSIFAIQTVLGTIKDENNSTLFGRLNQVKKVAFAPRAWFEADLTLGLSPLTVNFTSLSTGTQGPVGVVLYYWDFGDGTKITTKDPVITKTYQEPGIYSVALEVTNNYGANRVVLNDLVKVRPPAPDEAKVTILPQPGQMLIRGGVRTTVNQFVVLEASENSNQDPIAAYTWQTANGFVQRSGNQAKAIYEAGGMYDVSVRTDSKLGAFRITTVHDLVDVIEPTNLWLWLEKSPGLVSGYEFGLISETFKTKQYSTLSLGTNASFLAGSPNETMQREEFRSNNLFLTRDSSPSGFQGESIMLWASGRGAEESPASEGVMACSFNAFLDMYSTPYRVADRPWNWAGFAGNMARAYLIGGSTIGPQGVGASLTNDYKLVIDFNTMETNSAKLYQHNYVNGAQDLKINLTDFNKAGDPLFGHFSRQRTTWAGNVGYLVRSGGPEDDYKLKCFYKTDGTMGEPFINITKLLDLPEPKADGQLLSFNDSVYFLSGGGDVFGYSDLTNSWEVGESHAAMFHNDGKFLATTDKDKRAYISFGSDAFVKYNALDSTFTTLGHRPSGEQWLISVY